MSYIVIPVYNFACDAPGCNTSNWEYTPANQGPANVPLLTIAHRLLRKDGWTVRRVNGGWEHLCPDHKR